MGRQLQAEDKRAAENSTPKVKSPRKPLNPLVPSGVRVTSQAGGRPMVAWTPSRNTTGVVRYRLYRDGGYVASTTASHFRFSTVPCGAQQRLGVRAIAASGNRSPEAAIRYRRMCASHRAPPRTTPELVPAPGNASPPGPAPGSPPAPAPVSHPAGPAAPAPVSHPAGPAPPGTPSLVIAPTITGSAQTGGKLLASTGVWNGALDGAFSIRWYRCRTGSEECVELAGRAGPTYVPTRADVGFVVRAEVIATGSSGSATELSAPTGPITLSEGINQCAGVSVSPTVNVQALIRREPRRHDVLLRRGCVSPRCSNRPEEQRLPHR